MVLARIDIKYNHILFSIYRIDCILYKCIQLPYSINPAHLYLICKGKSLEEINFMLKINISTLINDEN